MTIIVASSLAGLVARAAVPGGWLGIVAMFLVAAVFAILLGLVAQAWVASVQIRSFSRRPDANAAVGRLFEVYGWRARLGCKLFRVPLPKDFDAGAGKKRSS